MPVKPPTLCRICRDITHNRNGYCDLCQDTTRAKSRFRFKKTNKFYGTARWKKFRNWYAKRNPLCEECLKSGRIVGMNVVDHIVEIKDGGMLLSEKNARSLCNKCHAKKTASVKQEREGRVESPPIPSALPFGSLKLPSAKMERGGIRKGGSNG